jgi:hypothetical protein
MDEKEPLVHIESNDWTDERLKMAENEEIALEVKKVKADPRRISLDSPQMQEKIRRINEISEKVDKELAEAMEQRLNDPNAEYVETDDFFESLGLFSNFNDVELFEDFLHMFFDGGGSEMPFDKEYYSSYLGSKKFKIVDEEGNICENPVVFEALKPHLQKYGYQLTPDNFLVKKENTKMDKDDIAIAQEVDRARKEDKTYPLDSDEVQEVLKDID